MIVASKRLYKIFYVSSMETTKKISLKHKKKREKGIIAYKLKKKSTKDKERQEKDKRTTRQIETN